MAKITGILAGLSLILSAGKTPRKLKDLPRESVYLLLLIIILFASALVSPVSRADAFFNTLDFAKVYVVWILTYMLVTTLRRLRRIVFIQNASVAVVSFAAIIKGHSVPRLSGVIGGFYSNPNDLAFGVVLALPFCLAFLFTTKSTFRKMVWCCAILVMAIALFMTASRAGFIDLLISGAYCLYFFGIKGKRHSLLIATIVLGALILAVAGGPLFSRFASISTGEGSAYGSYVERQILMARAIEAIVYHPLLGVGAQNFISYSGLWRNVHVSYLQIGAEAGIPGLILYLMFFYRGFVNLRRLASEQVDREMEVFVGASRASLIGFVVGACFAPEAYQFFPYFAVCYTSVLLAMVGERKRAPAPVTARVVRSRFGELSMNPGGSRASYAAW